MYNRYRLTSTVYDREDEAQKIIPEKRVFLSVEGNVTEKEYFDGLSKNRVKIGINAKVDVEVLRRGKKDTNSAPQQVIELLEEYIRLREQNEDDILQEVSEQHTFVSKEVSDRAHHGKSGINFARKYLPLSLIHI